MNTDKLFQYNFHSWRNVKSGCVKWICLSSAILAAGSLFLIIASIFISGFESLNLNFILTSEDIDTGSGILNAIVGSLSISLLSSLIALPFAFGTAVYLTKYAGDGRWTRAFRFLLEVLSGTPSIIIGVFGFLMIAIYLQPFSGGWSLLTGSAALALLIVPVIERAIEDAILRIPTELEEGSYALGADKWGTLKGITIPIAMPGLITGFILGFGRAAEESAIVILTAGYTTFLPEIGIKSHDKLALGMKIYPFQDQVATLPTFIYRTFNMPHFFHPSAGFAAAFVLIILVLCVNLIAKGVISLTMTNTDCKFSLRRYLKKTVYIPILTMKRQNDAIKMKKNHGRVAARENYAQTVPTWTLALTQPIPVVSSYPSEKSIATPHLASTQGNPAGPLPVDTRSAVSPAAAGHSLPPAAHGCGDAGYPDLLEDDPDGPAEPDPGSTRRTRHPAGAELLEEPHIPLAETWRSMTKNQQENMHV